MFPAIEKRILIHAPINKVWKAITDVNIMTQWTGEPELELEIATTWKVGSSISIKGFHHAHFENKGVVLEYLPEHSLSYNFLSSLSRLPDEEENYTIIRFVLAEERDATLLSVRLDNFPTETIERHLNFYWNATLGILKEVVEDKL